jgi:hypothetical protein
MSRSTRLGSQYASFGVIVTFILYPIAHALEYCTFFGLSFGNDSELESPTYWFFLLAIAIPVVPWLTFILCVSIGRLGLGVVTIIFGLLAIIYQAIVIGYSMVIFATCEGDLQCADNMQCDGSTYKPYGGPSTRFILLFAFMIAMFLVELLLLGVVYSVTRILRALSINDANELYHSSFIHNRDKDMKKVQQQLQQQDISRLDTTEQQQTTVGAEMIGGYGNLSLPVVHSQPFAQEMQSNAISPNNNTYAPSTTTMFPIAQQTQIFSVNPVWTTNAKKQT